jgi:hypothetical protein
MKQDQWDLNHETRLLQPCKPWREEGHGLLAEFEGGSEAVSPALSSQSKVQPVMCGCAIVLFPIVQTPVKQ